MTPKHSPIIILILLTTIFCAGLVSGCEDDGKTNNQDETIEEQEENIQAGEAMEPMEPQSGPPVTFDREYQAHLVFYALPNCPRCDRTKRNLNRLRPQYMDTVRIESVSVRSERGRQARKKYGFTTGMVLKTEEGEVLWKKEGQVFDTEEIDEQIRRVLEEEEEG